MRSGRKGRAGQSEEARVRSHALSRAPASKDEGFGVDPESGSPHASQGGLGPREWEGRPGVSRGAALAATLEAHRSFESLAVGFTATSSSKALGSREQCSALSRQARYQYRESKHMIEPHGNFMARWNLYLILLMAFTAFITPYEVSFLETSPKDAFYWVIRVVDFSFFLDIAVNLNLIIYDEDAQKYVSRRSTIALRYLQSYFALDLLSILPYDEIVIAASHSSREEFQSLRILRCIRLLKLLRILRLSGVFVRFESKLTIPYGVLKLWRNMLSVLLVCHWMACMFHLLAVLEHNPCNWIHAYFSGNACLPPHPFPSSLERYVAALYLATYTVATVGYGDVPVTNLGERMFLIVAMLIGAALFAYVVGNICDVLLSLSRRHNEFQELMDTANAFIGESHLSIELSDRVRTFLRNRRLARSEHEMQEFMQNLSPALRADVALEVNRSRLSNVEFFRDAPKQMLVQISLLLHPEIYPPLETVISPSELADRMYIIKSGLLAVSGIVRGKGLVVGEDMVFKTGMRGYKVATIKFTELLMLRKEDLFHVLADFPKAARDIRAKVVHVIFREKIIQFRDICRRVEASSEELLALESPHGVGRRRTLSQDSQSGGGVNVRLLASAVAAEQVQRLLSEVCRVEGCAFPVALLAISLCSPRCERLLGTLALRIQRAWRACLSRRAVRREMAGHTTALRAEAEALRRAAEAEQERERDAAPVMGMLGNERVVIVYGPAPLAAEQLRKAVEELRAQVAALQGQVASLTQLLPPLPPRKKLSTLAGEQRVARSITR